MDCWQDFAQQTPPVHDITKHGLYLLRDADLPEATGVGVR
jgi:hypothetical protein